MVVASVAATVMRRPACTAASAMGRSTRRIGTPACAAASSAPGPTVEQVQSTSAAPSVASSSASRVRALISSVSAPSSMASVSSAASTTWRTGTPGSISLRSPSNRSMSPATVWTMTNSPVPPPIARSFVTLRRA